MPLFLSFSFILSVNAAPKPDPAPDSPPPVSTGLLKAPKGFQVELVARVPNAREMALSAAGILYVASKEAGVVSALDLKNPKKVYTIARNLEMPSGIALHDGDLYVATVSKIIKFGKTDSHLASPLPPILVTDQLPKKEHHGWKFIAFGPDGKLYAPVGAPCNLCNEDKDGYASIRRMNADGSEMETIAHGIRNTVGFDWNPKTKELWFTENGRDWLGDDTPPDELNRLSKIGMHFGFPFCHAGSIPDPEFGGEKKCSELVPPVQSLSAHAAALGMRFSTSKSFPAAYQNGVFIAEHGSWNRAKKAGIG